MSNVQFDSDQTDEFGRPPVRGGSDLTGKLIKMGIAKDRKQAEYVLIAIGILALLAAYLLVT